MSQGAKYCAFVREDEELNILLFRKKPVKSV